MVGAGLAGLAAARRLRKEGRDPVVLEARDRVGGRTLNQDLGDGRVVEMGGQWIGPTQDRMYELASDLGVSIFPTYDEGDEIVVLDGKARRYSGELPKLGALATADFVQLVSRIERLAKRIPVERPWEAPRARRWDRVTAGTWLDRASRTRRARELLELYLEAIFAADTASFSLLHLLFYVRSGTSFEILAGIEGGAQQDRFVGGSQRVAIELAEPLADAVVLGAPVLRILQDRDSVVAETPGLEVRAQRAIVSVPPALALGIAFDPPLPAGRHQLYQRMPQGTVTKINLVYEEPWWRDQGLKGFAAAPRGLVELTADNSPPEGSPGVLVAFVQGEKARWLARHDEATRRKAVASAVTGSLGPRAASPVAYHELDWSAEPWTRGCYGGRFTPGTWTQLGPLLREPVGRIHWAGTETSAVWNGYMEGAVRSGERAADEVISAG